MMYPVDMEHQSESKSLTERTCDDIRNYPMDRLVKQFGKFGPELWKRSHGIDERGLSTNRQRKSYYL